MADTEIRIYMVDITDNRADGITINSPIEEFMDCAEQQGYVMTLGTFIAEYNHNQLGTLSPDQILIRMAEFDTDQYEFIREIWTMIDETIYFIGVDTEWHFFQLGAYKDKADADNKYRHLKEEKDSIVIVGVPRGEFLAISLNVQRYKEGVLRGTECLNRVEF